MPEVPDPPEHPVPGDPILASDAERDHTLTTLSAATAEGRLTLEEMVGRVDGTLTARTRGELAAITADLPAEVAQTARRKPTRWLVGIMGGMDRKGRWRVARRCWVVNIMGGCDLDLRAATVEDHDTDIVVFSLMGGSDIVVPEGLDVDLGGFAIMGGNSLESPGPAPAADAPTVRVRAYSLMGGTDVKTAPARALTPPAG